MTILKPCPCGKTPTSLYIQGEPPAKWMLVSGDCCGEWMVEFRAGYHTDADRLMGNAVDSWNSTDRGDKV